MKDYIEYFLVFALTMGALFILLEGIDSTASEYWTYAWLAVVAKVVLKQPISSLWSKR